MRDTSRSGRVPPLLGDDDETVDGVVPELDLGPKRPLVFLAEDDAELRRCLRDALRDAGFDVFSARTGHEMLELLRACARGDIDPPDAIVMDVRMPRYSGIDVLGALRLAEWPQPVVIMTGFGDPEVHERAASYGASVVLDKPFEAEELVNVIDLLVGLVRAGSAPS